MDKRDLLWPVSRCIHQVHPEKQARFPVCGETELLESPYEDFTLSADLAPSHGQVMHD